MGTGRRAPRRRFDVGRVTVAADVGELGVTAAIVRVLVDMHSNRQWLKPFRPLVTAIGAKVAVYPIPAGRALAAQNARAIRTTSGFVVSLYSVIEGTRSDRYTLLVIETDMRGPRTRVVLGGSPRVENPRRRWRGRGRRWLGAAVFG